MSDGLVERIRSGIRSLQPGGGLLERTIKSGVWHTATNVIDRVLQLASVVVLARLLAPSDFGLMGIALLVVHALRRFSTLGINEALIHNEDEDVDRYLNTVWVMESVRGLALAAIALAAAPLIASATGEPRATPLIRVIALSPLLLGLKNPAVVYFKKHLEFHKQFVYVLSGSLANVTVAITLAVLTRSVWALVLGYVATDVVKLIGSYALHGFRPWPDFELPVALDLVDYGKWLTGNRILHFLINEGDDAIVVWLLSAASLGLYQVAYRLAMAPAQEITQIISSVTFPAYSKLQDDTERLRSAFYRTVQVTTFVTFPIGVGIIAVAPTFVLAFLGEQWLPMVPAMQLIAVNGLLLSFTSSFGSVWMAVGRPDYLTKIALLRLPVMVAAIVPATQLFGITGAAAAVVAVYVFPTLPIDVYLVLDVVDGGVPDLFGLVAYPLAGSLAMGAAVVAVRRTLALPAIAEFAVLVGVGVATYVGAAAVLERVFGWGLERQLRDMVQAVDA